MAVAMQEEWGFITVRSLLRQLHGVAGTSGEQWDTEVEAARRFQRGAGSAEGAGDVVTLIRNREIQTKIIGAPEAERKLEDIDSTKPSSATADQAAISKYAGTGFSGLGKETTRVK